MELRGEKRYAWRWQKIAEELEDSIKISRAKDDSDAFMKKVLSGLLDFKALTMGQVIDILLDGKARKGYYIVEKLKKRGLVRAERVPGMYKSKYIVLTKKGAELLKEDIKLHEYYVRREDAGKMLDENEICRIILNQGVDEIMSRQEALELLKISPVESGIKWVFKAREGYYATYLRYKGLKGFIEKSVRNVSNLAGHIIIYDNDKYLRDDRRVWLSSIPAPSLRLTTLAALPSLIAALKDPDARLAEFVEKLTTFVSAGTLVKTRDAPLPLAWQKGKTRMLMCDLSTGDITGPALMRSYSLNQIKERGWGDGVIYYVEDRRSARTWAGLLKNREGNYFVTRCETGLYGARDGKFIQLSSK